MAIRRLQIACTALAFALLVGLAAPAVASAASYRYSGKSAFGWWGESTTESGWRDAFVFAGEGMQASQMPGTKPSRVRESAFGIGLSEYDAGDADDPTDDYFKMIDLYVSPFDAGIDRRLSKARIAGTYPATVSIWVGQPPWDEDPEAPWEPVEQYTTDMEVDLTWTASGPMIRSMGTHKEFQDGWRMIDRYNTQYRRAAIAGFISVLGEGWFVDGAQMQGDISNSRNGSVQFGEPIWW